VLLAGAVSTRKRQVEVIEALGPERRTVVAGDWSGEADERSRWEAAVERSGAVWLGHVGPGVMAALQRSARVLVHLSGSEVQSLSVLESLAQGTRAVLSDIPSHRELQVAFPDHVRVVRSAAQLAAIVDEIGPKRPVEPPAVPSWDDVARRLVDLYRGVLRPQPA